MPMPLFPRVARCALIALLLVLAAGCASRGEVQKGPAAVDLPRFMGTWHVVAHIPYFAERGHVAARYEYAFRDRDKVGVAYHYREGFDQPEQVREARASVKEASGNREWTLWFVGVVPAKWRIVEVAPRLFLGAGRLSGSRHGLGPGPRPDHGRHALPGPGEARARPRHQCPPAGAHTAGAGTGGQAGVRGTESAIDRQDGGLWPRHQSR